MSIRETQHIVCDYPDCPEQISRSSLTSVLADARREGWKVAVRGIDRLPWRDFCPAHREENAA